MCIFLPKCAAIEGKLKRYKAYENSDLRFVYEQTIEDIRFVKKQEWQVAYYVVLLQAVIFAIKDNICNSLLLGSSIIASVAGLLFLVGYFFKRKDYRITITTISILLEKWAVTNEDNDIIDQVKVHVSKDMKQWFELLIQITFIVIFALAATIVCIYIN